MDFAILWDMVPYSEIFPVYLWYFCIHTPNILRDEIFLQKCGQTPNIKIDLDIWLDAQSSFGDRIVPQK
jgi:hypothetical protein